MMNIFLVGIALIAALASGCAPAHARDAAVDLRAARQRVYSQPPVKFERAALCKPKSDDADASAADLAPIFVLQLPAAPATFPPCPKTTQSQAETRSIYSATTTSSIYGVEYSQRVFVWWSPPRSKDQTEWRALRMTFNNDGLPMIWEIIDPSRPILSIYVARSLEQKAVDKYKGPLPGRRFAIEQAVNKRPEVVVTRVLDDGPMPMGPMVYLDADGDVATVICRCMPSQVAEIEVTDYYRLLSLEDACDVTFNDLLGTATTESPVFAELIDADWLERALRIDFSP